VPNFFWRSLDSNVTASNLLIGRLILTRSALLTARAKHLNLNSPIARFWDRQIPEGARSLGVPRIHVAQMEDVAM